MTEKEKAINDIKKGMALISKACKTCEFPCVDCPFFAYCKDLRYHASPRDWDTPRDWETDIHEEN